MKRLPLLLALAALAVLPPSGRAAEERPEIVLSLAAERTTVPLGEEIRFRVELERKRGRPVEVRALRFGPASVSLRVQAGGTLHTLTRLYGSIETGDGGKEARFVASPPPPRMLVRGEPLALSLPILAVRSGRLAFQAVYRGLPEDLGTVSSNAVEVEVTAEEGKTALGAELDTTEGKIVLDLWPDRAMNTVLHFLTLAREGFYDGLTFHRVLPGYLVQGGDPKGDGTGGPGWFLPSEADATGKHEKGVISLAHVPGLPDSGGSQFFLLLEDAPRLDGRYTAFGRVAEGMEVLEKLAATPVEAAPDGEKSHPVKPPTIRSLRPVTR